MLGLDEYKRQFNEDMDCVSFAVFELLIAAEEDRPGITRAVLREAERALDCGQFNLYRPWDPEAWHVLAHPIRVYVESDFDFARLHMLAIIRQAIATYVADKGVLRREERVQDALHARPMN
ncbi:hypothetical protein BH11PAT2_BH11PAT2_03050 [soil metagenome]